MYLDVGESGGIGHLGEPVGERRARFHVALEPVVPLRAAESELAHDSFNRLLSRELPSAVEPDRHDCTAGAHDACCLGQRLDRRRDVREHERAHGSIEGRVVERHPHRVGVDGGRAMGAVGSQHVEREVRTDDLGTGSGDRRSSGARAGAEVDDAGSGERDGAPRHEGPGHLTVDRGGPRRPHPGAAAVRRLQLLGANGHPRRRAPSTARSSHHAISSGSS